MSNSSGRRIKIFFYFLQQNVMTHQLVLIIAPEKLRTFSAPAFKEGKQERQQGSDI